MGIPTRTHLRTPGFLVGAALALCGLAGPIRAEEQALQNANAPYATPISKLQVMGSAEKFSVDADHADVQSVLKAIFNQANAQFTSDSSVVGQVTLRLTGQSLPTTLDAVCKQLLLHYRKDAKGIYLFEQDTEATRVAILRIKDQNSLLRQQLRSLGLSLPEDNVLDSVKAVPPVNYGKISGRAPGLSASPGRGFGGSISDGAPESKTGQPEAANGMLRPLSPAGPAQRRSAAKSESGLNDLLGGLNYLTAQDLTEIFALNPQNNELQNPDAYRALMQQNGLVFINTGGQKVPVTEVLQELGRQSNTRIVIDPTVPTGPKFTVQGYISARTLPEALNVLTQSTRLTWQWRGASILVTALPDFQVFFNSTSPRVIFGAGAYPTSQNGLPRQQYNALGAYPTLQNGGQGQQQNSAVGAYSQPSQTPLPITNGGKKTP